MKFLAVCLLLCVGALAEPAYKKYGITTPEEIQRNLNARIIQGNPAGANQIPYQIYQIMTQGDGSRYTCGASIISTRWAVTAAHCLLGASFTDAYMGNVRIDSAPVVWRSYNLHVHPGYNSDNLNNDIALFGFDNDLPFGDNIWSINLARNAGDSFEGQIATASGYGVIYDGGPGSDTLMYVSLRVISNGECSNTYGGIIIDSTICTVGTASEAQGTCFGDSGGPLALGSGRDATLIGIVSFVSGNGCESPNPAGFVRPTHFQDWIGSVSGVY